MNLRQLEDKDAPLMLEWMHDENVYSFLGEDFPHMTIDNCRGFIFQSFFEQDKNRHYAIVDEQDEYMGTISLKEIDEEHKRAEYTICCRTKAHGKGFAEEATKELFRIAKEEIGLQLIYLNVFDYNIRAQKMYEKVGFERIEKPEFITEECVTQEQAGSLLWYQYTL